VLDAAICVSKNKFNMWSFPANNGPQPHDGVDGPCSIKEFCSLGEFEGTRPDPSVVQTLHRTGAQLPCYFLIEAADVDRKLQAAARSALL